MSDKQVTHARSLVEQIGGVVDMFLQRVRTGIRAKDMPLVAVTADHAHANGCRADAKPNSRALNTTRWLVVVMSCRNSKEVLGYTKQSVAWPAYNMAHAAIVNGLTD